MNDYYLTKRTSYERIVRYLFMNMIFGRASCRVNTDFCIPDKVTNFQHHIRDARSIISQIVRYLFMNKIFGRASCRVNTDFCIPDKVTSFKYIEATIMLVNN